MEGVRERSTATDGGRRAASYASAPYSPGFELSSGSIGRTSLMRGRQSLHDCECSMSDYPPERVLSVHVEPEESLLAHETHGSVECEG